MTPVEREAARDDVITRAAQACAEDAPPLTDQQVERLAVLLGLDRAGAAESQR